MKKTFHIIRFYFKSPLHISNEREDYGQSDSIIHSDTLTAAIQQSWAMLGQQEWIQQKAGFAVSSLYPFTDAGNQTRYFFPKPFKDQPAKDIPQSRLKAFKKVQYYDQEAFCNRLNEGPLDIDPDWCRGAFLSKSFKQTDDAEADIMQRSVVPRIQKPRDEAEDTRIFYMERIFFKPGAGLFAIVDFRDDEYRSRVKAALDLLADNGLGTDRTVGHGHFDYKIDTLDMEVPEETGYQISLGLFCPSSSADIKQMVGDKASYNMIKRGGWISEPYNYLRKRSVYMFTEGSVFKASGNRDDQWKGRVADLKPDIPTHQHIWRSGVSLFLPINMSKEKD